MPRPKKDKGEMLRKLADFLESHKENTTEEFYNMHWSKPCHSSTLRKLFGSWTKAKKDALAEIEKRRDENEVIRD